MRKLLIVTLAVAALVLTVAHVGIARPDRASCFTAEPTAIVVLTVPVIIESPAMLSERGPGYMKNLFNDDRLTCSDRDRTLKDQAPDQSVEYYRRE